MKNNRPTLDEELALWNKGVFVIGIDEVGRGAFAGPLVVGAVVYKPHFYKDNPCEKILNEVNDSKLILPKKREELSVCIREQALAVAVAEVSVKVINTIGIGKANQLGFRKAIQKIQLLLPATKLYVLADGFPAKYVRGIGLRNQKAITKGDQKSITIASASIIAKIYRDRIMSSFGSSYKKYLFEKHKGYGTKEHQELLRKYGLSTMHRPVFCRNIFT